MEVGLPHSIIYHCQHIMDCILSQVKVDSHYLTILTSISLYIASSSFMSSFHLKKMKRILGFSYVPILESHFIIEKPMEANNTVL